MASSSLTITDAYSLIKKKMLINKLSARNLSWQIKYSHDAAKMQLLAVEIARAKIKLIDQLNSILEQQLREFCPNRQVECMMLYNALNDLDEPTSKYKALCQSLEKYNYEMMGLMKKINHMESQIPEEVRVTNYNITIKPNAPVSTATTCAQEENKV